MTDVVEQIESLIDDYDCGTMNSVRFNSLPAWLGMSEGEWDSYQKYGTVPQGWEPPEWTR